MIHSEIPLLQIIFCLSAMLTIGVTVVIVVPYVFMALVGTRMSRQAHSADRPDG